jgi:hypothetical protein
MKREHPIFGDEMTLLRGWLDFHRATLVAKCEGLSDELVKTRPVDSSDLSMLGLVRHLTNMEASRLLWWAGQDIPLPFRGEEDFEGVTDATPDDDLMAWREMCRRGDEIVAASSPDDVGATHRSLRSTMLNLIYEYSRHMGHADILRELLDGATGQ